MMINKAGKQSTYKRNMRRVRVTIVTVGKQ